MKIFVTSFLIFKWGFQKWCFWHNYLLNILEKRQISPSLPKHKDLGCGKFHQPGILIISNSDTFPHLIKIPYSEAYNFIFVLFIPCVMKGNERMRCVKWLPCITFIHLCVRNLESSLRNTTCFTNISSTHNESWKGFENIRLKCVRWIFLNNADQ